MRSIFLLLRFLVVALCALCLDGESLRAEPPVASYIFPAGGQRGTTVNVRVGGFFLHSRCGFEMLGPSVEASRELRRTRTVWFEGPLLPVPESQQQEDYPQDMAGQVRIAADAPPGGRFWRTWTAQGATSALRFVVGDLPEVVEQETDGAAVPVRVRLPVTINGRIFPREDVDLWAFDVRKGQTVTAVVCAARLGSPLDARLEVQDPHGRTVAESDDARGPDPLVRFTAAEDGAFQVKIHDLGFRGGQAYVYRLTLTADPYVDRTYPLGGRRGTATAFTLEGQGLPPGPATISLPPDAPPDFAYRLPVGGKFTNPFRLDVDDLPEYREEDAGAGKPLALPAMANGRIARPGEVDSWRVALRKGEVCALELRAVRLGSPLAGVLTVRDAAGKELARGDSDGADPTLAFTAPADGTYEVRVADRFHSRGGSDFAYRLRLDHPSPPDFRLRLVADALALPRGGSAPLKVQAERLGGFTGPIALTVEGLPPGVTAGPATIPENQNAADVPLKAAATAAIRAARLTVRGAAAVGPRPVNHVAAWHPPQSAGEVGSVLLAVTVPTPFKILGVYDMRWAPRGTVYHRHYRLERGGFTGPIRVNLADRQARHLQGVTGPTITVPPGADAFDYAVTLPPWMETGRTCRVCVMAVGLVRDADGSEHEVSFSSVQQNEQMVAVIEPGRLGVQTDRGSLLAAPGATVTLGVRVERGKGLAGPVKVELVVPPHVRGVRAEPVEVPADRAATTLTLRFSADALGPFNMPVTVRATIMDRNEPVTSEAPVEILAGP
jgi:hypothetical protein